MKSNHGRQSQEMDEIDRRILNCLQHHGELSNVEISRRVHLSASQCWRRIRNLRRKGVISGYSAVLNRGPLGLGVLAFVNVTFDKAQYQRVTDLRKVVHSFPEVLECHAVTGDHDYLLKVVARDLEAYGAFLNTKLIQAPGVTSVRSVVSLDVLKSTTALPIETA